MRFMDRVLQVWRARKARRWIPAGARVLDIGCHQGEFLRGLGERIGPSVGMDPRAAPVDDGRVRLLPEPFRQPLPLPAESFDAIVMLATLEHIRDKDPLAAECARVLVPGGRVIITVPAHVVDSIVAVLVRLRLADGMSLDEHHGYDPAETPDVFGRHGFELEHHARFQFGCNHLFVLRRRGTVPAEARPVAATRETANAG